jgi:Xaa-Pro aminopeptidase
MCTIACHFSKSTGSVKKSSAKSLATSSRKKAVKLPSSILFHADASDPDMLYFSGFGAVDPFIALSHQGRKIGLAPSMEYGRMTNESNFDEVLLLHEVQERAAKRFKLKKGAKPSRDLIVRQLAAEFGIREFRVSDRFPAGLAMQLQEAGLKLVPVTDGPLFPEREIKTPEEVELLRKGNQASAAGFRVVAKALADSKIKNGKLHLDGRYLTAERLRDLIAHATLDKGAVAVNTITAAGEQACDCHNEGTGLIPAHELIVVDIFPRRAADGYWGDMTRTFLKGKANEAQRKLVATVRKGHTLALDMIKPGVSGGTVHEAVEKFFDDQGYPTVRDSDTPSGFFHALGHCIGLEVHEDPVMRRGSKWRFRKGMVTAVEPGLYYRGLGGCRIEDVVHVTADGCEKISKAPYRWEIA